MIGYYDFDSIRTLNQMNIPREQIISIETVTLSASIYYRVWYWSDN
jgi:hypothetical protein